MPTLQEQAIRLLRAKWREPNALAEELFAILSQPLDIETSQITLYPKGEGAEAPIIFRGFGDDETLFDFRLPDGSEQEIEEEPATGGAADAFAAIVGAQEQSGLYILARSDTGELVPATVVPTLADDEVVEEGTEVLAITTSSGTLFTVPTWQ